MRRTPVIASAKPAVTNVIPQYKVGFHLLCCAWSLVVSVCYLLEDGSVAACLALFFAALIDNSQC